MKLAALKGDLIERLRSIVKENKAKYLVLKTLVDHVLTSDPGYRTRSTSPAKAPQIAVPPSPRRSPTTASAPASAH